MQNGQVSLQIDCRRKGNTILRSEFGMRNQSLLNRNAKTMFPIRIFWPVPPPPLSPSPCCDFLPALLLFPVLFRPRSSCRILHWKSLLPPSSSVCPIQGCLQTWWGWREWGCVCRNAQSMTGTVVSTSYLQRKKIPRWRDQQIESPVTCAMSQLEKARDPSAKVAT